MGWRELKLLEAATALGDDEDGSNHHEHGG
jgi:hypothetical protein